MKDKVFWLAALVAVATAGVLHVHGENQKAQHYSWATQGAHLTSWEESKHALKYMPPLPPNIEGFLFDGNYVPRSYFDLPPALRSMMPVLTGEPPAPPR